MEFARKHRLIYAGMAVAACLIGLAASWTDLGQRVDSVAYDWFFRMMPAPPAEREAVVLAIDDDAVKAYDGLLGLRQAVADGLALAVAGKPKAIAIDLILSGARPGADEAVERGLTAGVPVVLSSDLYESGREVMWEDPLPRFRAAAGRVGHVHAEPDPVCRELLLVKRAGIDRRFALALEAFAAARGARITESPLEIEVAGVVIPAAQPDRAMRIRFAPGMPTMPLLSLKRDPGRAREFAGKTVFLGVTSQVIARDRQMTPLSTDSRSTVGVEIHANVYETIAQQSFLTDVPLALTVLFCALLAATAAAIFMRFSGTRAYLFAGLLLAIAHAAPAAAFAGSKVLSMTAPAGVTWLAVIGAGSYQFFVVRRRMLTAEGDRERYQQAMHFVTHEMKTPLAAIQGSSELIGRYALTEDKRKQMAGMINSESKRLAKMIEVFLNVERLEAGQMDLEREPFDAYALMQLCVERVRPIAEQKRIAVSLEPFEASLVGDRELMDYAFYNLLTNAVKYSPQRTEVRVSGEKNGKGTRISVWDQGIGMTPEEVKNIFKKFYRTEGAETSGEKGTGIGLSIVEQIVVHHGGRIEVSSRPGEGSCFTLVL